MRQFDVKLISKVTLGFLLMVSLAYIALNWSYFYKQLSFLINKPEAAQTQNTNAGEVVKHEPNKLRIPSLRIDAPVVYTDATTEEGFQIALRDGVVHYPGTAEVGQTGNTYIFGHSSDMAFVPGNFKTVFALLPSIQKDAEIFITNKEGIEYRYKVYDQFVANNTDVHLLEQNTDGKKILTLQTSYPIGTALRRYIVKAELQE